MFNNLRNKDAKPYLRNAWNILDFIVVLGSIVDLAFEITKDEDDKGNTQTLRVLKVVRTLRILRALRPLRMISRNEGLKLVVNSLISSVPSMTNVMLVCMLFIMIFAITGIDFFKGKFYYCDLEGTP